MSLGITRLAPALALILVTVQVADARRHGGNMSSCSTVGPHKGRWAASAPIVVKSDLSRFVNRLSKSAPNGNGWSDSLRSLFDIASLTATPGANSVRASDSSTTRSVDTRCPAS